MIFHWIPIQDGLPIHNIGHGVLSLTTPTEANSMETEVDMCQIF